MTSPTTVQTQAAIAHAQAMVVSGGKIFEITGLEPLERIKRVREGFSTSYVDEFAKTLGLSNERAYELLKLKRSTVLNKRKLKQPLDTADSERLLAVMDMVEQVRAMVERSGNPTDFDPSRWLAAWLETPVAALGGQAPASFLDTNEGVQIVRQLLQQMETGAYA